MAGHNKWSSIKHKKGAADAKRSKVFTKVIKEITVAARLGGGDPNANPRLRSAIALAKSVNMPNDNVTKAIKKGVGGDKSESWETIVYEGYGPHNVAVIVECLTDNKNRTISSVRAAFSKNNGNI
ncbi:MAG: YebC/PmpR family DNA-binding transcriptional regulator, partial [Proteobacteria bacterium]|nr:YebC/PmpR family DNA-binding transcriptional regulator [Pseudomonadota bacterium]